MKVYALIGGENCEGGSCYGVFSTEEKAKEVVTREMALKYPCDYYDIVRTDIDVPIISWRQDDCDVTTYRTR